MSGRITFALETSARKIEITEDIRKKFSLETSARRLQESLETKLRVQKELEIT